MINRRQLLVGGSAVALAATVPLTLPHNVELIQNNGWDFGNDSRLTVLSLRRGNQFFHVFTYHMDSPPPWSYLKQKIEDVCHTIGRCS